MTHPSRPAPLYPGLRRSLAVTAGVLLLGGAVALAGRPAAPHVRSPVVTVMAAPQPVNGGPSNLTSASSSAPATTAVRRRTAATATGAATTAAPRTTSAPPATEPPQSPLPSTVAPSPLPEPLHAPAPGTYRLSQRIDGQEQEASLVVRPGSETVIAGGRSSTVDATWSTATMSVTGTSSDDTGSCTWSPALRTLQAPLTSGAAWHADGACERAGATGDAPSRVHQVQDSEVGGRSRADVDGTPVDVWLIRRHTVVTVESAGGTVTIEQQSSELFAPSLGLVVALTARTDTPRADGTVATTTLASYLEHTTPD